MIYKKIESEEYVAFQFGVDKFPEWFKEAYIDGKITTESGRYDDVSYYYIYCNDSKNTIHKYEYIVKNLATKEISIYSNLLFNQTFKNMGKIKTKSYNNTILYIVAILSIIATVIYYYYTLNFVLN